MTGSISVIVPSYNSARTISYTLKGLLSQTMKPREIIVADSSDDGVTPKLISGFQSDVVTIMRLPAQTMPAIARNAGAGMARGEVLAFIDADAYPAADWLERVATAVDEGCLMGGGSVALAHIQKGRLLPLAQFYLQFNEYMDVGLKRVKRCLPSCNMFCEKKLFDRVGGFPEIRASEDILFSLKVNEVSRVWFIPGARIYHIFREDLTGFLRNQMLLGRYSILYRQRLKRSSCRGLKPLALLPAFWFLKPARMIWRVLRSGPGAGSSFLKAAPLFFLGLLFWDIGFTHGFAQGCFHDRGE